ncbi:DUF1876 domain-containing protein [Nocardioides daeguensis]|uniref:DUF1876 domain-containing protein n=1 Tax=Nocardioides daeguensis TaxID=908359 RepID=A0ABP6UST7_9ACTN|nr:DUF1876 domain-containing protein [Nocardioides daeguensis]MBV6728353.1 DUF1876 domain-containing protein [Nocardioides daeguensis]MCR1773162.1 DUF1876 domain-containing protein [Nocardioides daeguensis]
MHATTWHVEIHLSEDGQRTRAEAVLRTTAGTELRSVGLARRSPDDRDAPEIGDELAVCRALSALAHDLFEASVLDVEANTGTSSTFTM